MPNEESNFESPFNKLKLSEEYQKKLPQIASIVKSIVQKSELTPDFQSPESFSDTYRATIQQTQYELVKSELLDETYIMETAINSASNLTDYFRKVRYRRLRTNIEVYSEKEYFQELSLIYSCLQLICWASQNIYREDVVELNKEICHILYHIDYHETHSEITSHLLQTSFIKSDFETLTNDVFSLISMREEKIILSYDGKLYNITGLKKLWNENIDKFVRLGQTNLYLNVTHTNSNGISKIELIKTENEISPDLVLCELMEINF
ncbi:MAG: hypothetical protein OHK0017_13020 [Patescibacteria group bacterium]